jgi:hypothetical protein
MRITLLPLLFSSLAFAGSSPTGTPCEKSNECVSLRCFAHVCRPDNAHPGGLGALCEGDGQCVSKNCLGSKCGPPKEKASSSGSTRRGGSRDSARAKDPEQPSEPVEAPLPEPTPCSEDLLATVYKDKAGERAYRFYAADECLNFRPEVIAAAKELFSAGYGRNFGVTLRTVKEATAEQLTCAKQAYDKHRDRKSPSDFGVPLLCLQPQEVIACVHDLEATVFKGDESQAKLECDRRAPATIATAKELFAKGYGPSFANLCEVLEKATPEQLECTKRDYEFLTAGRTKFAYFSLRGPCLRRSEVMACYFELMGLETPERQYDDRNRTNLENECANLTAEDIALSKFLRGLGYTQGIESIADTVRTAKPARRACVKGLTPAKVTAAEKADARFRMPEACMK